MTVTPITAAPSHAPRAIDAAQLLDETHSFLERFVSFSEPEQADAVTLWVVHTHAFAAAETTPRLAIQSSEPQSGKTRLLECVELLAANPMLTASLSSAAMFRTISDGGATLLIDEVDTVFHAGKGHEDLRGLLNAGYRRGSCVSRVLGGVVERLPVFAAVALAGIGRLPATVQDRSIVIRLKRKPVGGAVARLRRREVEPEAAALKESLEAFASANTARLASYVPDVPEALGDRAADVWEPLLAIADSAGGSWRARARAAAVALYQDACRVELPALTVEVVGRFRAMCDEHDVDRVSTADVMLEVSDLVASPRDLASCLRLAGAAPRVVRQGDAVFRGYLRSDLV